MTVDLIIKHNSNTVHNTDCIAVNKTCHKTTEKW